MVRRLKKNLISDERAQPLPLRARQGLRTVEKRAVGPISTPGVRQRRFISEDPSLYPSSPPPLLPFHLFQAAYRRPWLLVVFIHTFISLFLKFNLLFGNVAFEKHDSFILYFMYRLLLLWWSPNRCCCQGNKQRIGFSWLGKKLLEIISRKIG